VALVVVIWFFPPLKNSRFPGFIYFYLFLFFYFMLVFIIDLEHREILYFLSTIGLIACIGIGIWLHEEKVTCLSSTNKPILNGVINTLIGCITGALVMFGLYLLGLLFNRIISRIRKTKVDEVALGFGDVILSGILGALLGFPGIFACLALGILMGGLFSLVYIIVMKIKGKFQALTAIPYAPFLIISAMVLLYVAK
jgi:leader peptidase (prepilin peptidase)/N-methyltransferase